MQTLSNQAGAFAEALRAWYREHARDLPWRHAPSLYATVVSEFMLQQTQVATVLPYYARWMERFPDFQTLASAREAHVLKAWEGLGYYARARNLHRLARELTALPEPPRTREGWLAFRGIGPYTAAAVASIVYDQPAAVVDGNVVRILARLTAEPRPFAGGGEAVKHFTALAEALLPSTHPGDHNQAMMELGATVCLKRGPLCTVCPVVAFCAGARTGEPEAFPNLQRRQPEQRTIERLWIRREADGALLLHRTDTRSRRLADLYELPDAALFQPPPALNGQTLLATRTRGISNQRLTEHIHAPKASSTLQEAIGAAASCRFITPDELEAITLSGPHRRWIRELLATEAPVS